ncbi:hypothetical protein [Enterobacter sp. UNJFSC 003]|uniref:hypothetical protein n=1 Tax=Enterobacter sp. UNJFSC 003 TaxID=3122077 RepID=UPI002EBEE021|nr:hypothetical protein [Serratia liquefaciens]
MINHKSGNTVASSISNHHPVIVLTDNYWLYFGISQLYPQSNVIHVRLSDEELHRKLWGNASSVVLIVDNDIFIQGAWLSLMSLFEICTFQKIIWLQSDKTGSFTPFKPGKSYLVEKKKTLKEFLRNLNDIFCGRESLTGKTRCTRLTKSECSMIKYLAAEHNVKSISTNACLSLKSIYHVRSTLMSKFGFENACFFQFILFKNIDILFPSFTHKVQASTASIVNQ